jgi:hypothetical protein
MLFKCIVEIDCLHEHTLVAELSKIIELPFAPYPDIYLALVRQPSKGIEEDNNYAELLAKSSNPAAGIIFVERVLFSLKNVTDEPAFRLTTNLVVDEDLERLWNFITLMERFYGFEVDDTF